MFTGKKACYRPSVLLYLVVLAVCACLVFLVVRGVRESRPSFDVVGLIGSEGESAETFSDSGQVQVRGEIWRAITRKGIIRRGDRVMVVAVEPELTLVVERAD